MTIADTVHGTIEDNWGNGGYGGDTPSIDTTEVGKSVDITSTDVITVLSYTLQENPRPVNDTYTNRFYFIDVQVSSKTSAAQLTLLVDETEYLLRNTVMTSLSFVNVTKNYQDPAWNQGRFVCVLTVELVSLMSSGAITPASSTGYNWHEAMMITSTYAAWVPCIFLHDNNGKLGSTYGEITNQTGGAGAVTYCAFEVPLPPLKGTLKLYISGIKFGIFDADANDYLTNYTIYGFTYTAKTNLRNVATDYTSQQNLTDTFTAVDCSGYDSIKISVQIFSTTANDFDLNFLTMRCYYDT